MFGDQQLRFGMMNGAWAEVGVNLNDHIYLELRGLGFWPQHTRALLSSDAAGNPLIARPVFNTLFGEERSFLTSSPGLIAGSTLVGARSPLFSIEANARYAWRPT